MMVFIFNDIIIILNYVKFYNEIFTLINDISKLIIS